MAIAVPTRSDVQVAVRAAAVSALALGLACLVTAATDEGGIPWGVRAGRALPLTPECAALGAWIALAPVLARGEALAVAALGRSYVQVAAAAVVGGAFAALVAAAVIGSSAMAVDLTAFFPRAALTSVWTWQQGSFVDLARGLKVGQDGAPMRLATRLGGVTLAAVPHHGRAAAALATALTGVALPSLAAHALLARSTAGERNARDRPRFREDSVAILASGATVAASAILFQAATVRHVSALWGSLPPVALLTFAWLRYRASP